MIRNRFNPLFAAIPFRASGTTEIPNEPPAAPDPAPEPSPADPEQPEEEEEDPENPETPATPESAPEAAPAGTAPAKLTAFQRGALRALSMGDLVARVEKAEGETQVARLEVSRLHAENGRLQAALAKLEQETPARIAEAEKAGADAVAKGVTAELASLGITADAAPSQLTAASAEKIMTRAEFEKLDHPARNAFMRDGGKLTA